MSVVVTMKLVKLTKNFARYTPEGTDLIPGDIYLKRGSLADEMPERIAVRAEAAQ